MMTVEQNNSSQSCLFNEIASAIGCALLDKNPRIDNIAIDSRLVSENGLFIAIAGAQADGRKYIDQSIAAGAVVVLAESEDGGEKQVYRNNTPVMYLDNLKEKVGVIASCFYERPTKKIKVIGVTGTNGKTTCAQLLQQMFQLLGQRSATIGTMGYGEDLDALHHTGLTTPDAVTNQIIFNQFVKRGVQFSSIEVSSHGIDQHRQKGIAFSGSVFTNLTQDHLDYHRSMEAYAATKAKLFSNAEQEYAIVNIDDEVGAGTIVNTVPDGVRCVGYSIKGKSYNTVKKNLELMTADNVQFMASGVRAEISSSWGNGQLESELIGEFNLYNLLAVIAAACCEGFLIEDVLAAVRDLKPICGRMQKVEFTKSDIAVIVDYAHTPDALTQAVSAARAHTDQNLWLVFGCGGNRDAGKRSQMGRVAESLADKIIVTSDNPRKENPQAIIGDIVSAISSTEKLFIEKNREKAIGLAVRNAQSGDLVLIAGKGHENYQVLANKTIEFNDYDVSMSALTARMQSRAGGVQ